MKIAVYDRYWSTGGGGEKFAAGLAAALRPDHEVTLLAHQPVELGWLAERLQLDLAGITVQQLDSDVPGAVARASAEFELFVNASYVSDDANQARRGAYVVHFPGPRPSRAHRAWARLGRLPRRRLQSRAVELSLGGGFYQAAAARLYSLHWSSEQAEIVLRSPGEARRGPVTLYLGRYLPPQVAPLEVTVELGGEVVGRATVTTPTSRLDRRRVVPLTFEATLPPDEPTVATLRTTSWVPRDHGIGVDTRRLGVPLVGWQVGSGVRRSLAKVAPLLVAQHEQLGFLDSYDLLLSNSEYTRRWVRTMWRRDSQVLYPPVSLMPRLDKERIILSVGRFFVPGTGHNKKQLEMIKAFAKLVERGRAEGWELHLVGGCAPEHEPYLAQVEAAARGLPVVVHRDASGQVLRDLYGRASIYWHAAGLDESPKRFPERLEHFGITTVEAMSAGAVPVVIDAAGQVEIVEQGVTGYRFGNLTGLVTDTERLMVDPVGREQMSRRAEERARAFGWDAFVERVRSFLVGSA
jgi:glycosyltransferase involved in cell wall biosynthesis